MSRLGSEGGSTDMPPLRATLAQPLDRERSMATLVAAFIADPLMRWMFPDARQYLVHFPALLRFFGGRAFEHRSAYRSEDHRAAALWLPPGVSPDLEGLAGVVQEGVDAALRPEVFDLFGRVSASHPAQPHWHLPVIGVDPRWHGAGYGSALLSRGLETCDRERVAAYLEATNPDNVPLYERFGFEVAGAIQTGSSPVVTAMLRAVR
jgi:GNAT superfamily N-acetyltransferase